MTIDVTAVAALLAEPARARMLDALMGGVALTATELALCANVTSSTASSHLGKLVAADIIKVVRRGRHRYFRLADEDVAHMIETLAGFAARDAGWQRRRIDPALVAARVCYDHLAGATGVWLASALLRSNVLSGEDSFSLTEVGERFLRTWGLDLDALRASRRPLCRTCLDWSERRFHLGGSLGAAILQRIFSLRWAKRMPDSRAVAFTVEGQLALRALLEMRSMRAIASG